jgi:hypothetical protein
MSAFRGNRVGFPWISNYRSEGPSCAMNSPDITSRFNEFQCLWLFQTQLLLKLEPMWLIYYQILISLRPSLSLIFGLSIHTFIPPSTYMQPSLPGVIDTLIEWSVSSLGSIWSSSTIMQAHDSMVALNQFQSTSRRKQTLHREGRLNSPGHLGILRWCVKQCWIAWYVVVASGSRVSCPILIGVSFDHSFSVCSYAKFEAFLPNVIFVQWIVSSSFFALWEEALADRSTETNKSINELRKFWHFSAFRRSGRSKRRNAYSLDRAKITGIVLVPLDTHHMFDDVATFVRCDSSFHRQLVDNFAFESTSKTLRMTVISRATTDWMPSAWSRCCSVLRARHSWNWLRLCICFSACLWTGAGLAILRLNMSHEKTLQNDYFEEKKNQRNRQRGKHNEFTTIYILRKVTILTSEKTESLNYWKP